MPTFRVDNAALYLLRTSIERMRKIRRITCIGSTRTQACILLFALCSIVVNTWTYARAASRLKAIVVSRDPSSSSAGDVDLWRIRSDGSRLHRVLSHTGDDAQSATSSDGRSILFVSGSGATAPATDGSTDNEIYRVRSDGSNLHRLTDNSRGDVSPSWSPNGHKIAFERIVGPATQSNLVNGEIFVMRRDGTHVHRLTNNEVFDGEPSWSPNGGKILFTSNRSASRPGGDGDLDLYVMRADGSHVHRVISDNPDDYDAVWSPDGHRIAYVRVAKGSRRIFVAKASGTNAHQVTHSSLDDASPTWSPSGHRLVFVREDNLMTVLLGHRTAHTVKDDKTSYLQPACRT